MNRAPRQLMILVALTAFCAWCACAPTKWGFYRSQAQIWDDAFIELTNEVTDFPLVGGNRIDLLINGEEIFPAMFEAMENAKETINVETYILYDDGIGRKLCDLLVKKAKEGVVVRLIYDYFGERLTEPMKKSLTEGGVRHFRYNEWSWWHMFKGSFRTHRKILVVDGRIGFTGGMGFAEEWRGDARTNEEYRDTQVRVEGPLVSHLQATFSDNWLEVSGEKLEGDKFFPAQPNKGTILAASVGRFTNEEDWSRTREMFLLALAASRRYFYINTAYFVPDHDCYRALADAVERGVEVKMVLPGPDTDLPATRVMARKNYGRMLQAGVKIYEYQGTLMHAKTFVADGLLSMIGSTNFTNRSFTMNHEDNLLIYDEGFATQMMQQFAKDLERSNQVTLTEWSKRRLSTRAYEQVLGIIEGWY